MYVFSYLGVPGVSDGGLGEGRCGTDSSNYGCRVGVQIGEWQWGSGGWGRGDKCTGITRRCAGGVP